jgi:hypothetical protein
MSRPRFLVDHNFNEHIVRGLRLKASNMELVLARDVGLAAASDPDVLAWAESHGMIVLSHDVNTMSAAAYDRMSRGESLAGLLLVRLGEPLGIVLESILMIWEATESHEWRESVAFLPL